MSYSQPIGNSWYYSYNSLLSFGYIHLNYTHDTLISGKNYRIIEKTYYGYTSPGYYDTLTIAKELLRWENDSVFRIIDGNELLLFDFNLQQGDTMHLQAKSYGIDSTGKAVVDSIGFMQIGGVNRRWISVSPIIGYNVGISGKIVEGIGPIEHYFFPEYIAGIADASEGDAFRCIWDNSTIVYNSNITPQCDYITGISEIIPNEYIKVSPNPFSDICQIEFIDNHISQNNIEVNVYDASGTARSLSIENYTNNGFSFRLTEKYYGIIFISIKVSGKEFLIKTIKI
ncbi:MAG: hypothetical protein GY756_18940 [bacterium]|nr:hypothetical protein [bacterium]